MGVTQISAADSEVVVVPFGLVAFSLDLLPQLVQLPRGNVALLVHAQLQKPAQKTHNLP